MLDSTRNPSGVKYFVTTFCRLPDTSEVLDATNSKGFEQIEGLGAAGISV
jgi:hypothetical protein